MSNSLMVQSVLLYKCIKTVDMALYIKNEDVANRLAMFYIKDQNIPVAVSQAEMWPTRYYIKYWVEVSTRIANCRNAKL